VAEIENAYVERKSEHSLIVTKKKNMTMEEFMYELVG